MCWLRQLANTKIIREHGMVGWGSQKKKTQLKRKTEKLEVEFELEKRKTKTRRTFRNNRSWVRCNSCRKKIISRNESLDGRIIAKSISLLEHLERQKNKKRLYVGLGRTIIEKLDYTKSTRPRGEVVYYTSVFFFFRGSSNLSYCSPFLYNILL